MSSRLYDRYRINYDDAEVIKKSKKTRNLLILFIFFLLVGIGGLGYLGYDLLDQISSAEKVAIKSPTAVPDEPVLDVDVPPTIEFKKTKIPNLTALFGKNINEVQAVRDHDNDNQRKPHRYFVGNKLSGRAHAAKKSVLGIGSPAAEHNAIHTD